MPEKRKVAEGVKFEYEGVLDFTPFMRGVVQFLTDRGYGVKESGYSEVVKPDHKEFAVEFTADKKATNNTELVIVVAIDVEEFKDVVVEMDGKDRKLQTAKVSVNMGATIKSDIEGKWEGKPWRNLFKNIYEKYVVGDVMDQFQKTVVQDMKDLKYELKKNLNMFRTEKE